LGRGEERATNALQQQEEVDTPTTPPHSGPADTNYFPLDDPNTPVSEEDGSSSPFQTFREYYHTPAEEMGQGSLSGGEEELLGNPCWPWQSEEALGSEKLHTTPDTQSSTSMQLRVTHTQSLPELSGVISHREIKRFEERLRSLRLTNTMVDCTNLISADAQLTIMYLMDIQRIPNFQQWRTWDDNHFFRVMSIIFPDDSIQAALGGLPGLNHGIEEELKAIKFSFDIDRGALSLVPYVSAVTNVVTKYNPPAHRQRDLVALLLKSFPPGQKYIRLRETIGDGAAQPATIADFLKTLGRRLMSLQRSANDLIKMGYMDDYIKKQNPQKSFKPQPTGFHNPRAFNKSDGAPSIAQATTAPLVCHGCGRRNHLIGRCRLKDHPDYNHSSKPWVSSPNGLAWKAKGHDVLPYHDTLSGTPRNVTPQPTASKGPATSKSTHRKGTNALAALNTTNTPITNELCGAIVTQVRKIPVMFLIDSGCLQDNYINRRVEALLQSDHVPRCSCSRVVCSAMLAVPCAKITHAYEINLEFLNEKNECVNIQIMVSVLDSYFDLILGLPTIRKHILLAQFSRCFEIQPMHEARVSPQFGATSHSSSHQMTPPTLAALHSLNKKPELPLLDYEVDDDEIEAGSPEPDSVPSDSLPRIHGSEELQARLRELCIEYSDIFDTSVRAVPADLTPLKLTVNRAKWERPANRRPPRIQTVAKQYETAQQIEHMLALNIIQKSQATEFSQVLLTPKPNNKWRFCVDFRNLNECSESMGWPIPNIEQMLQRIGQAKPCIFGSLDFTSGYHQAPLSEDSRRFTAFITFMGVYEWLRVPMGLKGAPAYFQQAIASVVLSTLLYHTCELYIDDILVYGRNETEFVTRVRDIFEKFRMHKVTLNPAKCELGLSEVEFVGHVINGQGITFSAAKREDVVTFRKPVTQKDLKSFLGLANYFRSHIRNHSMLVRDLHAMVKNYKPQQRLQWDTATEMAFKQTQDAINNCPTLYFVDYTAPICLHTDASDYGLGAYLFQTKDATEYPVAFISKALRGPQINWSTFEKEAYAIFYAFKKLEHLIRDVHFTLRTDHKNLLYLNEDSSPKVIRWKLAIQEYDFDVAHIRGTDNVVADAFSRLLPIDENIAPDIVAVLDAFSIPAIAYQRIKRVHNSSVGHHGVERTLNKLLQQGHKWTYMREHVRKFIHRCPCCQKMSFLKVPIVTHPFTTGTYDVMERVNIDTIGPLPKDDWGHTYILVMIDCFSRFVELYATRDATALSAASALLQFVGRYGCPAQILSDQGPQFANNIIQEFTRLLGTEHVFTLAYSKQENSIVERVNKEVMRHLRAMVLHTNIHTQWSIHLPLIQRILNAEVRESLGVSPAQIVFGNAIVLDRGIILPHATPADKDIRLSEWTAHMLQAQAQLIQIARETQLIKDTDHMQLDDTRAVTQFDVNSYVLVQYENRPPSKLHTPLKGPLRVVNHIGSRYTLQNLVTNKLEDYHVTQLRPFNYDPTTTNPRMVANKDYQVEDVDRILSHQGNPRRRNTLKFLVHWSGRPDSEDSYVDWSTLRNTEALHTYLRAHGLRHMIPKKYLNQA